jgi:phage I-like protein
MKSKTFTGSFRSAIDLHLLAKDNGGKVPNEIAVLPYGIWQTVPYGEVRVDENVFNQMVANFDSKVRKAVPVDVDHDGGKAAGWISKLINKGTDGLWAVVEWTKYGEELLSEKLYRLFSPEWSFDYQDPEYSTHHGAVLVAGSLTNRPLFKELPMLIANDKISKDNKNLTNHNGIMLLLVSNENTMNIDDILKKPVADRTPEEVAFIKENEATLTEEQKALVAPVIEKTPEEVEAEAKAKADAEAEAAKVEAEKVEAEKVAAEKAAAELKAKEDATNATVTITAAEANEFAELKKQNKLLATEKEIAVFMANENGGKVLPKSKDALVNFVLTCNDAQKTALFDLLNQLPDIKVAGVKGDSEQKPLTAKEQLDNLISEKVKSGVKASEATRAVLKENAALAKQYDEELKLK